MDTIANKFIYPAPIFRLRTLIKYVLHTWIGSKDAAVVWLSVAAADAVVSFVGFPTKVHTALAV